MTDIVNINNSGEIIPFKKEDIAPYVYFPYVPLHISTPLLKRDKIKHKNRFELLDFED